jgi:serine/threonine-protein kinase
MVYSGVVMMGSSRVQKQQQPPDRTGQVVAKRYKLLAHLDKGGQGSVYRARDLRDQDDVAIKVLHEAMAADSESRERMFREARALTQLTGTAAVRILDQQWTDDGALCLVMELLRGADLEAWLHRIEHAGGQFPVQALDAIFAPIVRTLEVAHSHGIVHRDLKPANVFICDADHGGGVKLLDFGFAKFTRLPSFTAAGFVAGSPSYIAPEAWMGRRDLDHRIDVYAVGAMIFRALAARPPFYSSNLGELLHKATSEERPSLHALRPDLPASIDDWVKQALAIDRNERFLSVRGMWAALKGLLG